ncbi:MAG: L-lysine 6-transaminase [Actinobacteria bacterium]|nr:L-lysine 6-transaminase [Actinomycetota bacterium]
MPGPPHRADGSPHVEATQVLTTLRDHLVVDGYDFVLDLEASEGSWLVDARDGTRYLDMFTFFASNALGMNHPRLTTDEVRSRLATTAVNKPSNSDVYTRELAGFVATFEEVLGDPALPYLFLIEGGALAVENALKAAFDWKSRHNEAHGRDPALGTRVLHLEGAFHGRTGYTMSLTNTDPRKVARFPKFDWPRMPAPALTFPLDEHDEDNRAAEDVALAAAEAAFAAHPHDIACFIAEPIQAEGGDRHLSPRFLQAMQALCRGHDALFVIDEVQTGVGLTGTTWAYQQLGVEPDLVAFGKKLHVCGVMGGGRLDEVEGHVWRSSSRINSTFGGNLVDMVRATEILRVVRDEALPERAGELGGKLLGRLRELQDAHASVSNARGRGLMCAIDLEDGDLRDRVTAAMFADEHVFLLGCGPRSVRFRPPLTVTEDELDLALTALDRVLTAAR